jgi:hypothetical protein
MDIDAYADVVSEAQLTPHTTSSGHLKTLRVQTTGAVEHTSR